VRYGGFCCTSRPNLYAANRSVSKFDGQRFEASCFRLLSGQWISMDFGKIFVVQRYIVPCPIYLMNNGMK
jgi:hypothetical protein